MNCKKIEKECPESYKALMSYCDIKDFDSQIEGRIITATEQFERMWGQRQYTIRDLYDFFDEQEIREYLTREPKQNPQHLKRLLKYLKPN